MLNVCWEQTEMRAGVAAQRTALNRPRQGWARTHTQTRLDRVLHQVAAVLGALQLEARVS